MAEALAATEMLAPLVPLVANVTAAEVSDPSEIRDLLVRQVTGLVRWRESMLYMKSVEVELLAEIGSGKILTGLARRIDRELAAVAVGTPQDIDGFVKSL